MMLYVWAIVGIIPTFWLLEGKIHITTPLAMYGCLTCSLGGGWR